jgi:uncharacterized integral membrane protein
MTAIRNQTRPDDSGTGPRPDGRRSRSRVGELWVTLVVAAFVLLLLLIFILQNGQQAQVSFLGAHGNLPMGVALLLAAVFGVLLVALPGTVRILQLRTVGRRTSVATSATGATAADRRPDEPATADQRDSSTHRRGDVA